MHCWPREIDIIYKVLLDADLGSSLPLSQADFGLWFNHKGRHYFSGIAEVGHISRLIQDFDGVFNHTLNNPKNLSNRSLRVKFLLQIRNTVSQIITLLRELFEEVSKHEVGMDVLTKLLNRRFLPTIFKREIAHANRVSTPLSTLIIDVDKFKEINDTWGHNTGMRFYAKSLRPFMTMSAVVIMCFVTVATSLLLSLPKPAKMTPCVLPSAFVAG